MKLARVHYIIYMLGFMLMATSCGRQYQAEQRVKDFVEENMEAAGEMTDRDFADVGTTRHISDSLIQVMRHRGAPGFKTGINYAEPPEGDLLYLRMKYVLKGDTLQNTFYLDQEAQEVVAFK